MKRAETRTPENTSRGEDADVGEATAVERPVVARYTDYRDFLRAMIGYLKATRRGFSYRSFALKAGFSSPSFLKLVADGQRNLSNESVDRVARGLGLDRREGEIFEALVDLGQSETDERRARAWTRISRLAQRDPVGRLASDQFEMYSRWYPFVLRELASLPDFDEDADALGRRLRFPVRTDEIKRALSRLEALGLLKRGAGGKLEPADKNLTSGPEVRTLAVRSFHRQMLKLAETALDQVPPAERNITGVTVPLTRTQYQRVVELATAFRREVLAVADGDPGDERREVHQLTMALVPLTAEPKATGKAKAHTNGSAGRTGDEGEKA